MANILTVSIIGGGMILVIVLLRALLQNRLHRTVFLVLWLLAALRLAVPVVLPSTASIYNFLPQERGWAEVDITGAPSVPMDIAVTEDRIPTNMSSMEHAPIRVYPPEAEFVYGEQKAEIDGDRIVEWAWLGGAGLCFLYFGWVHIRARRRYRFALPEEAPDFLGNIRLKRSDEVSAPLVYGFFRPVILLPVDFPKKDSPEYEQVLYHELTHVRSGDLWFKLGMLLVTCVHWFNPLVWLMLYLSTQDLEIRCDARVISKLGKKKTYAMTLVQAEVKSHNHFAEAAFAFSLTELRLNAIAKTKVYLPRSILLCTILAVVLVCCFATGPSAKEAKIEIIETVETEAEEPTETEELTEATEPKPLPTLCLDEEDEMEYLLSCGFEEYGSTVEVSLKEGERKTIPLKLPEELSFSIDPSGKDKLSLAGEYSYDEELYYLTITGLDEGTGVINISVAGHTWMSLQVEILFDLYYSIPDAYEFEPYGSAFSASITSRDSKTVSLKLPERATYVYDLRQNGESIPYYYLSTFQVYNDETGTFHLVMTPEIRSGEATFYFYVDGIYWCKVDVSIRINSGSSSPSYSNNNSYYSNSNGYYNYGNDSSWAYDYLSQIAGPQPAFPGAGGNSYGNYGPIISLDPVHTGNGNYIPPGVYWP